MAASKDIFQEMQGMVWPFKTMVTSGKNSVSHLRGKKTLPCERGCPGRDSDLTPPTHSDLEVRLYLGSYPQVRGEEMGGRGEVSGQGHTSGLGFSSITLEQRD
jgi:hypothetical protein